MLEYSPMFTHSCIPAQGAHAFTQPLTRTPLIHLYRFSIQTWGTWGGLGRGEGPLLWEKLGPGSHGRRMASEVIPLGLTAPSCLAWQGLQYAAS